MKQQLVPYSCNCFWMPGERLLAAMHRDSVLNYHLALELCETEPAMNSSICEQHLWTASAGCTTAWCTLRCQNQPLALPIRSLGRGVTALVYAFCVFPSRAAVQQPSSSAATQQALLCSHDTNSSSCITSSACNCGHSSGCSSSCGSSFWGSAKCAACPAAAGI